MNKDDIMGRTPTYDTVQVGDALPVLRLPPTDRTTLALFAGASGDHNPIHLDIDFARRAGLPDVFAQGMLGMAWLARLLTDWVPQSQLLEFRVRFLAVNHVGDAIACAASVIDKFEQNGRPCVRLEVRALDQEGECKIAGAALVALAPMQAEEA